TAGSFSIGELGFGTGSNFLLTRDCFLREAPPGVRLHYWSVDRHPLRRDDLQRALRGFPQLDAGALLERYPPPLPGIHRRIFDGGRVLLDLVWADAAEALADIASLDKARMQAWYLDGHAPAKNPDMWSERLFRHMANASHPGATFSTYSAAGTVRRGLLAAGFAVRKRPGYGRKRESLCGEISQPPRAASPALTPWDLPSQQPSAGVEPAIVLGAGLAGAHAAAALARRNIPVIVLDAGPCSSRASGNAQGVLFTRISHQRSTLADFSVLAFLYASDIYRQMFETGQLQHGRDGELSGCLQFVPRRGDPIAISEAVAGLGELAEMLSADAAGARLGTAVSRPGLWQPGSGWLSPPSVCRALLKHPGIELRENCGALSLCAGSDSTWEAVDGSGRVIAKSTRVVIATGSGSVDLTQTAFLPLKGIRGQTTQLPASPLASLQAPLCHEGYVAPAMHGEHCIGATFAPGDSSVDMRTQDNAANLAALADALPDWRDYIAALDPSTLSGRAEVRCASPDYIPMVGPVPNPQEFRLDFASLGKDAQLALAQRGTYLPGLFLSTALGSRGLSYAALSGEIVASQLCGDAPPLSRELMRAVAPGRFLIRDIIRGSKARPKTASAQ
ncbi:MAG: tRNA 5-methylaminomethyl-2-thiouridine biosynthesis bifunctional protein, partial [Halieaceae bacterium]